MPVSTRTRSRKPPAATIPNIDPLPPLRSTCPQEQMPLPSALQDKMRALTLLYEQHKRALKDKDNDRDKQSRFSSHPSVDLFHSSKKDPAPFAKHVPVNKDEGTLNDNCSTRCISDDFKENEFVGFFNPNDQVAPSKVSRKLSMGLGTLKENASAQHQETENSGADRSRILVFVRLRPMMNKEREAGAKCCVRIVNKRDVYLAESSNGNDYLRLKRLRGRHFTFDASFPDSTPQHEIYSTTTAQVVEAVLKGRNGSVFCYGATGAGKTYTMLGTVENPGVMVLAIKDLFDKIRQRSSAHLVHLSYLEVYNETVRDLLSPGRPLVLREDKQQGIVAAGLTQYRAYSSDEVMALLHQGNRNRTTEPTRVNETSSRSHAILQVAVEYQAKDGSNNNANQVGKLSLIDLAGSERALATDQRTLRSLEGANINKSLLALSSCINALVEGKKHIPYRNSKLTQLLKDSLGGTCITVMIANISPSSLSFGETQNTLHWADRAKEIRIKPCDVNEIKQIPDSETDQARLLLELQKENRELRMELARQQQKLMTIQAQTLAAAAASPTPSKAAAFLSPTPPSSHQPNGKRKPKTSFLGGSSCFVPELKGKAENDMLRELSKTVKTLEAEIERINKEYALQIKEKDDFIRELSKQVSLLGAGAGAGNRSHIRKKETTTTPGPGGDRPMKSPGRSCRGRVSASPIPTAKKRSFWDITTADSPSVVRVTGRKTKSHTAAAVAPSMLLQALLANETSIEAGKRRWR